MNELEKLLQEAFDDPSNLSTEKLDTVLQETLKAFSALGDQVNSKDPAEKQSALGAIQSIKDLLQSQTADISKKLGLDPSQLASFAENTDNFSEEEWKELSEMKEEISLFQEALAPKKSL